MADKPTSPPPAYFLSLSLENVRSFGEKQTISFARPDGRPAQWTIILGDNGVGKTTVLKSLASSVPLGDFNNKLNEPQAFMNNSFLFRWQAIRQNGKKKARIAFDASTLYLLTDDNVKPAKRRTAKVKLEIFNTTPPHKYPVLGLNIPPINLSGLICYGYGAGRTTGNLTLSDNQDIQLTSHSLFEDRADLLNPEEWFLQIDYSSKLEPKNKQLFRQKVLVEKVLKEVLPDIDGIKIVSIGTPQKPQIALQFLTPYGWVRLRDMSLGYQTLVVWLTDFASKLFIRYPDSKNPLEEPAIVLIDEIDLHLHPSWQRKLIKFLSDIFKNTQFIATAHSPLVVQAATDADANVVLLKREGDQTKVYQGRDLPDVRHWRLEQILSSELFDDTPPLSPQTEADLTRRNELLLKKRLTAKEKADLEHLNAALTTPPVGTTAPERRAEDLLAQLARNLGKADLLE